MAIIKMWKVLFALVQVLGTDCNAECPLYWVNDI